MKYLFLLLLSGQLIAQNYTFDQKVSFKIESGEGNYQSYYYLNTRTGHVGMDGAALAKMSGETAEGEMFMLIEYDKAMTMFIDMGRQKHKSPMPLNKYNYTAAKFWQQFKKTGQKRAFGKYQAEEYVGTADPEVGQVSIWLSAAPVKGMVGSFSGDVAGAYGTGYLYHPGQKAYYLVVQTHTPGQDNSRVTLLNIEPATKNFSAAGY